MEKFNAIINVRANKDVKRDIDAILNDCGLTISTATNIFLHKIIHCGGIPFKQFAIKSCNFDTVINVRVNSDIKETAEELLNSQNLTLSKALQMYFEKILNTGGIPFAVQNPKFNFKTKLSIKRGIKEFNAGKLKQYPDFQSLIKDIDEKH